MTTNGTGPLPLLEGKRLVITGVATNRSIAFSVAKTAQLLGAEVVLTSFGRMRRMTERAARRLPAPADVLELDVEAPADLAALGEQLDRRWAAWTACCTRSRSRPRTRWAARSSTPRPRAPSARSA